MTNPWVIADAHAGVDASADRALFAALRAAREARRDLLLLGDLCVTWIAFPAAQTPLQRALVEALRAHRAAGLRVAFTPGNRDFWVEDALVGDAVDAILDRVVVPLGGVPTWIEHGDLVVTEDRAYRAFRALVRSAPARAIAAHAPGPWVSALGLAVERRLADTNAAYKAGTLPLGPLAALGVRAAAAGARRAIVGHFHHERVVDVKDGAPVFVAPPWLEARRVLEVAPDGALVGRDPLG